MYISRLVIRNFRNFEHLDVQLRQGVTCIVGENNTGKTNLLRAIRLAIDANLSSQYRQLLEHDVHSDADLTIANHVLVSVEFSDYRDEVSEHALLQGCEVDDKVARIDLCQRIRSDRFSYYKGDVTSGTHAPEKRERGAVNRRSPKLAFRPSRIGPIEMDANSATSSPEATSDRALAREWL